jgi:predicted transcriptional regulator
MVREKWWRDFLNLHLKGKEVFSYVQSGGRARPKKAPSLLFFYITKPVGEIGGYAEFIEHKIGDAEKLWNEHGEESVLESKMKYEEFTQGMRTVSFVRFKNLCIAAKPIPISSILVLLGKNRLPRRGRYVEKTMADKLVWLMSE